MTIKNCEETVEAEELLTVKEMAQFLKVPVNTAYKMLLARVLPSFKMGKLRRARKSDIVAYIDANRVEAIKNRKNGKENQYECEK